MSGKDAAGYMARPVHRGAINKRHLAAHLDGRLRREHAATGRQRLRRRRNGANAPIAEVVFTFIFVLVLGDRQREGRRQPGRTGESV